MLTWTVLFYLVTLSAIVILSIEFVSLAKSIARANPSTPAEYVPMACPQRFRPVRQYEFTGLSDDGLACYDEIIVAACYLSDRPGRWRG
jgi:hypothetical protein